MFILIRVSPLFILIRLMFILIRVSPLFILMMKRGPEAMIDAMMDYAFNP